MSCLLQLGDSAGVSLARKNLADLMTVMKSRSKKWCVCAYVRVCVTRVYCEWFCTEKVFNHVIVLIQLRGEEQLL